MNMNALVENVYIEISVTTVAKPSGGTTVSFGTDWEGRTSVIASQVQYNSTVRNVVIQYNELVNTACGGVSGFAFYCDAYYQNGVVNYTGNRVDGVYCYGAGIDKQVGLSAPAFNPNHHGEYATYETFIAAKIDFSQWDKAFWTVKADGGICATSALATNA